MIWYLAIISKWQFWKCTSFQLHSDEPWHRSARGPLGRHIELTLNDVDRFAIMCCLCRSAVVVFFLLNWWTNMNKQSQRVYHLPSWSNLLSSCLDSVPSSSSSSRWPWQIKQWNVMFYHYRLSWCLDSFPHLKGNIRKLDLRNKICTGNILFDIFDGWNHGIQWIFLWFSINQPDDLQNWQRLHFSTGCQTQEWFWRRGAIFSRWSYPISFFLGVWKWGCPYFTIFYSTLW